VPAERLEERLSNLLAVTDTRLTRLDVDDLLVEVLDRLRAILEADTAAVLLAERGSHDLVARAACGLEEEVRQGVRVPIGAGFAGTIAARREPVILDRIDPTTVANPILWEKGIRHMLGVPLTAGDTLLGVLHVGRLEERSFNGHDAELLEVAAERVAAAIQIRRTAVESAAAGLLERELLPTRLPQLPGIEFGARYSPAEDRSVGGDWYDAFVLPSGALWGIIGDVAGHGLSSAVIVGRVKSALRSYALLGEGPARVLQMTNRKLVHFEVDTMVTVLCVVAHPPYDTFEICSAGHLPPLVANAEGAEFIDVKPGPPLGALLEVGYDTAYADLPSGATMLLYTDGLVERRGEPLDVGMSRLRTTVTAANAETVCRDVMLHLVGDTPTRDDVALLGIGRPPIEHERGEQAIGEMRLPATQESVAQARTFAVGSASDVDSDVRGALELLVSEVATNCVVHAASAFTVRMFRSPHHLRVECTDEGGGRVTVRHAEPDDTQGRGMYFVQQLADRWGVREATGRRGKTVWFSLRLDTSPFAAIAPEGVEHV
jgi:phosphoserine phosphatase RsbU/P